MIAYLEGKLLSWKDDYLVVNVNGVGYQVFVPTSVLNQLPLRGEVVSLHVHTAVREDAITLYGFLKDGELELFKQLITVSGIGPKVATGIISGLQISALKQAIIYEDVPTLKKIPGIGEKTAKRLILELKNKISLLTDDVQVVQESSERSPIVEEAIEALMALGYSRSEAFTVIDQIADKEDLQVVIRQALKILGRGKSK